MSRRIIIVNFYWGRDKDPRIPLGHASLFATLTEQTDLDVREISIPVNSVSCCPDDVVNTILKHTVDISPEDVDVAMGAYVWGEDLLQNVLVGLRNYGFSGRIILGGPQISYSGHGLENIYPNVNAFIRGYGEHALCRLAMTSTPLEIPGVHWANTKDMQIQALVDLELLPSPWLTGIIPVEEQYFIRWETQRGCPFQCAFCQHQEAGARLPKRTLSLTRIKAEIDLFCRSGVREIAVLDPIFNMGPYSIQVMERFAERHFGGRLSLQCRAETISDKFINIASSLDTCLEFGLQTVHKREGKEIHRPNNLKKVDQTLTKVRHYGIAHEVSLIFGLPLQTLTSFEESVQWCLEREVPVIKAFPLLLLRGTELERNRQQWGLTDNGSSMPMVFKSTSFSLSDWKNMARISEALRITEGDHPKHFRELLWLAEELEPDMFRWTPKDLEEAAS